MFMFHNFDKQRKISENVVSPRTRLLLSIKRSSPEGADDESAVEEEKGVAQKKGTRFAASL